MRATQRLTGLCVAWLLSLTASVAGAELRLSFGGAQQVLTSEELLARPDAAMIEIADDVSYKRRMRYRAVPLWSLIAPIVAKAPVDALEARAADGFVSQIPLALLDPDSGSAAYLAIEDSADPWPPLPGRDVSAGPFYIVWKHPQRAGIGSELWPYQLAAISGVASPVRRWPQMAVDAALPADAPARRGEAVFTMQCLPCHRMKGAGAADVGPDLGQPMNPTRYLTKEGLRMLIRDPRSVRTWPGQQMPAFDATKLSDADLDAVIAYLGYMAEH